MCTAITYQAKDHYFGRNLDLEYHFREAVTITPRNYPFSFRHLGTVANHFAMIGMATMEEGYPLYYDAVNEYGLSAAALSFPHSTKYATATDQHTAAPFELIPWLLCDCKTTNDVKNRLVSVTVASIPFSNRYPVTPLHWIIADRESAITLEVTDSGLQIYENPLGILTNEPPFPYHMTNLQNYLHLTNDEPQNKLVPALPLKAYSRGMGGLGLPGDLSSASRFVRAAFTKINSRSNDNESSAISQVFHILGAVAQQNGCVKIGSRYEKTLYSSCCNTSQSIYYYTTYENSQITAVRLHGVDLDSKKTVSYPLIHGQQIRWEN